MANLDDLYSPDFPHGAPAGYDAGCKGGACPNNGDPEWLTCREAKELVRSDYSHRNHPVTEPMKRHKPTANVKPAPPKFVPPPVTPVPDIDDEQLEAQAPVLVAPEPEPASEPRRMGRPKTNPPHGTPARYQRGCHADLDCPNFGTDQPTCRAARNAYATENAARRRARAATTTTTPEPSTDPLSDATPNSAPTIEPDSDESRAPDLPRDSSESTFTIDSAPRYLQDRIDSEIDAHATTYRKLIDAQNTISDLEHQLAAARSRCSAEEEAHALTRRTLEMLQDLAITTPPTAHVVTEGTGGGLPTRPRHRPRAPRSMTDASR